MEQRVGVDQSQAIWPPPFCTLDGGLIASALISSVMVSAAAGHERPQHGARDYCHNLTQPEARFVRDVLILSTKEICDLWLGGTENASRVIGEFMAADLDPRFSAEDRVLAFLEEE